jgi:hypothetical protein
MQPFFENNWLSILSILIGIAVAYVFYRLQKKDSASASAERKKHATLELLDVVESYIINKQHLSEGVIESLIHASERDHVVALRPDCTAISLLQDVALRLQRSRHLDIPQKSEYSEKIEQLIGEIRDIRAPVRIESNEDEVASQLKELLTLVPDEEKSKAEKLFTSIVTFTNNHRGVELHIEEAKVEALPFAAALIGISASLASIFIGSRYLIRISEITLSAVFEKIFLVLGALFALIVVTAVITIALRIRKRDIDPRERSDKTDD